MDKNRSQNKKNRVVITGVGMTCAIGKNISEVTESLIHGNGGIRRITLFDSEKLHTDLFGELQDDIVYRERDFAKPTRVETIIDKLISQMLEDSGITLQEIENLNQRAMLSMATSVGSNTHVIEYVNDIAENKYIPERLAHFPNYLLREFQNRLKIAGPYFVNTSACSAGTTAICTAFSRIRNGKSDLSVVVGVDPATEFSTYGFNSMKNMNKEICKPFDKMRSGINIGEGGGIMLLESLEHAIARHAKIYGEIMGYGIGNDAYHRTSPDPSGEGAYRSMKMALQDAELQASDISYVNAHGTGTQLNDAMEINAMEKIFANVGSKPAVNSTKDLTGHCLAAAGMVEAIICALAIKEQKAWGNNHLDQPEKTKSFYLINKPFEERDIRYAMSNSFAFAGHSASVILGKYDNN